MQTIKRLVILIAMLAGLALVQGCGLLLLGGAVAGATYGTVKYVNNTLRVTHDVSLDKVWDAANGALKELQMPVTSSKKDGASGRLESRNAQDQPVIIQATRKSDLVTEIQITVGTFDSAENRTGAQQIYDAMKARF
jgi:hypothetical protein